MIFDNIEFHNVVELEKTNEGYIPRRLPKEVRELANEGVQNDIFGTGVELRFKMPDGKCDLILQSVYEAEAPVACVYFGSFQGGWDYSTKMIYENPTTIHIEYPQQSMEKLKEITREKGLAFNPEVVRIVLPYTKCKYIGVKGNVEPPSESDVPKTTYLAYGSSITHGSLGLLQPYSYPFRIAQKFNCDYINLGHAGNACMEEAIAKYIVSRKDWTFASVEMGINTLGERYGITPAVFEERIDTFTRILAEDGRPVFATSIFGFNGKDQERATQYRQIVEKYAKDRLIFTDGLELLNDERFVSADLVHPTLEGLDSIVERWGRVMTEKLKIK